MKWDEVVFSKDVIVLEANMSNIGLLGFGFIENALDELSQTSTVR